MSLILLSFQSQVNINSNIGKKGNILFSFQSQMSENNSYS